MISRLWATASRFSTGDRARDVPAGGDGRAEHGRAGGRDCGRDRPLVRRCLPAPRQRQAGCRWRQRPGTRISPRVPIARSSSSACCANATDVLRSSTSSAAGALLNLHRFTHRGGECDAVRGLEGVPEADAPAQISAAGLTGRCQGCVEALRMLVAAYGAEAGNLAPAGRRHAPASMSAAASRRRSCQLCAAGCSWTRSWTRARWPIWWRASRSRSSSTLDAGLLGAAVHAQSLLD